MNANISRIISIIKNEPLPLLIFIFFLCIYSLTMFEGVGGRINFGDSAKWQYLYAVNGLPHGTGYPQFLVLSELTSRLLFFLAPPERITFISVFFGSLTLVVFYLLCEYLTNNRAGSSLGTFVLGFSRVFWMESTEAEVYTLNTFYLLSIFLLFIHYYKTKRNNFLLFGCFLYAFSFGNHLSMITVLPALCYILYKSGLAKAITVHNALFVAGFIIISLSQYLIIYLRAYSETVPAMAIEIPYRPTLYEFLHYVTGTHKETMLHYSFQEMFTSRFSFLLSHIVENFTALGLILSFGGFSLFAFREKDKAPLIFLLLAVIGQMIFSIGYDVPDITVFFIPIYCIAAIFLTFSMCYSNKSFSWIASLAIIFANVVPLHGYREIRKPSAMIYHWTLAPRVFYTQTDYPLFYPYEGNYDQKTYFLYKRYVEHDGKKILLNFHELEPFDKFYVFGQDQHLVSDTSLFVIENITRIGVGDYVKSKVDEGKAVFIVAREEASAGLSPDFKNYIQSMSGSIASLGLGGSYAAVIYKNNIRDQVSNSGPVELSYDKTSSDPLKGNLSYKLYSGGFLYGNTCSMIIEGRDYGIQQKGLNILTYNTETQKVEGVAVFDTFRGETKDIYLIRRKTKQP